MKKILGVIICSIALLSVQTYKEDKRPLLCQTWRQFAFKGRSDTIVKNTDTTMAKVMTFKTNGNYEEELMSSKGKGKWRFNDAQTKLGFTFNEYNGINLETKDTVIETNIIILKLTRDTLIYGIEGLYGGMAKRDHDDWYFVRVK